MSENPNESGESDYAFYMCTCKLVLSISLIPRLRQMQTSYQGNRFEAIANEQDTISRTMPALIEYVIPFLEDLFNCLGISGSKVNRELDGVDESDMTDYIERYLEPRLAVAPPKIRLERQFPHIFTGLDEKDLIRIKSLYSHNTDAGNKCDWTLDSGGLVETACRYLATGCFKPGFYEILERKPEYIQTEFLEGKVA